MYQHIPSKYFMLIFIFYTLVHFFFYFIFVLISLSSIKFRHLYINNQKGLTYLNRYGVKMQFCFMEVPKTHLPFPGFDHPNIFMNREPTFFLSYTLYMRMKSIKDNRLMLSWYNNQISIHSSSLKPALQNSHFSIWYHVHTCNTNKNYFIAEFM